MTRVIDAHTHLWRADDGFHDWLSAPGFERVNATFSGDELAARSALGGVDAVILVESGTPAGQDTDELLEQTRASSRFAAVVAWIDLADIDNDAQIPSLRNRPRGDRIVGFRAQVQNEDDDYLERQDVRNGLGAIGRADLVAELVLRPPQRESVLSVVDAVPETRFVIDHLGSPDFEEGRPSASWIRWMTELARRDNVDLKLSALHADGANRSDAGRDELIAVALQTLGPFRLAWGSDWPISLRAMSYAQTIAFARRALSGLGESERAAVFGGTAERLFSLART